MKLILRGYALPLVGAPARFAAGLLLLAHLGAAGCTLNERDAALEVITNHADARSYSGEDDLRVAIHFPVGHVIVEAGPSDSLYSLDADYLSSNFQVETNYEPSAHRLTFRLHAHSSLDIDPERLRLTLGMGNKSYDKNRLILRVSPKVKLDLTLKAGIGETKINLSRLITRSLEIESGVSSSSIYCATPNPIVCERLHIKAGVGEFEAVQLGNLNFRSLDFEGGIGSSHLDFSGTWRNNAAVNVKMGIGELQIKLPREVGAEVESEKKFLSGLHLESFSQRGSTYFSENYEASAIRLIFRLHTGIGSIQVKWL